MTTEEELKKELENLKKEKNQHHFTKDIEVIEAELKGIQEGRLIRENTLADVEEIIDEEIEIITRAKVTVGNTTISKKSLEIVRLFMDERILALEELKQEIAKLKESK